PATAIPGTGGFCTMSWLRRKGTPRLAIAMTAVVLVLGATVPPVVFGKSVSPMTLHRSCGDPSCDSTTQVAVPDAKQVAKQTLTDTSSVSNKQSNTDKLTATNPNKASATSSNDQNQTSNQAAGPQTNGQTLDQTAVGEASNSTSGGSAEAYGPVANVMFKLSQSSDASANGNATAYNVTGK